MRDWLTKDFYWKAFSLFMAVGVWLTVHKIRDEPESQMAGATRRNTYDVPVVAVSANTDAHAAQLVPKTVNVTVSGSPDIMNDLQASEVSAVVTLTGIDSAQNLPRNVEVSVPWGTTVVDIEPPQVTVTVPKKQ